MSSTPSAQIVRRRPLIPLVAIGGFVIGLFCGIFVAWKLLRPSDAKATPNQPIAATSHNAEALSESPATSNVHQADHQDATPKQTHDEDLTGQVFRVNSNVRVTCSHRSTKDLAKYSQEFESLYPIVDLTPGTRFRVAGQSGGWVQIKVLELGRPLRRPPHTGVPELKYYIREDSNYSLPITRDDFLGNPNFTLLRVVLANAKRIGK